MGLLDLFRKKKKTESIDVLDDDSYIQEIRHSSQQGWHQYDVLLAARGYAWDAMIDWANYMSEADLMNISTITYSALPGSKEVECIESFRRNRNDLSEMTELKDEQSSLAIGGESKTLKVPVKIVWFNQTRTLRFFTLFLDDEKLMERYIETMIRRTFSTSDAMKLAKHK
nr:hypothetical protein [Streptococcus lutetiensis]